MSIKTKMVKAICALTAISIVACASITGFAATYTTTTVYDISSDVVTASTVVSGVNPEEQVTYLVHNATGTIADSNIIYIDQDGAGVDGTVAFNYQTTKTKIGGLDTTVLVGSQTTPVSSETATDATIDGYTIEVEPATDGNIVVNGSTQIGKGQTVTFTVVPNTNFEIESVTIDGVAQTVIGDTYSVTGGGESNVITIAATFVAIQGESAITDGPAPSASISSETPDSNYITTFGVVSILPEEVESAEFGILFAVGEKTAAEMEYGQADVTAYPSISSSAEGKFAVQLLDGGSGKITEQVYTTRTYLKIGDVVSYGAVNVIN